MKIVKKISKIAAFIFLGIFVMFAIYANWNEPPLSDKLNIKPIQLVVFNLDHEVSVEDSLTIANQLAANKGVTASTVNRLGKTISVTYHADETSEKAIDQVVASANFQPKKINFAAFKGPQCPVPSEYIDFILNAKKALCFR